VGNQPQIEDRRLRQVARSPPKKSGVVRTHVRNSGSDKSDEGKKKTGDGRRHKRGQGPPPGSQKNRKGPTTKRAKGDIGETKWQTIDLETFFGPRARYTGETKTNEKAE